MISASHSSNIVAFVHTYQSDGGFDPYMTAVVHAFEAVGLNVHVICTNDLVPHLGATSLRSGVSETKLVEYINRLNPVFIFSTNRGGITQAIMDGTSCPIITRMVDLIPFYHQGGEGKPLFCERDQVFVPTQESVVAFEQRYPILTGKVHYLPFATDPDAFDAVDYVEQVIPVSFVGTYFYCEKLTDILAQLQRGDSSKREAFLDFIQSLKGDFHMDDQALDPIRDICTDVKMSVDDIRMLVSNAYALNKRIHYLDAVSDLGLHLYGTENWIKASQYSLPLISCFQFGEQINNRDKLIRLYQSSKIALNIPHHQAGPGMPYRVYDIMASRALLITEYHPDSELFSLFGRNMPVPMYRNAMELSSLVDYYLNHEEERLAIVTRCNALIREKKLTFQDKGKVYCEAAGVMLNSDLQGSMSRVAPDKFSISVMLDSNVVARNWRGGIKAVLRWLVPYALWIRLGDRRHGRR
ncbi:Glycosyl transferases group 1 [Mariprofundus aestuarium]|uniref:Glycosyl transferases group 1 n=1 Tax=Mariprofundus aestuarium TaxID=1921086 RepID=A0A2K8KZC5_MARES|nr:glycosyltransferase [Mariprofundus aestuarium]ATX80293.1 Glycosyl transferases group 1 [Mariprofundus aestuarium]